MGVMDMLEKGFDKIKLVAEDITRIKWLFYSSGTIINSFENKIMLPLFSTISVKP